MQPNSLRTALFTSLGQTCVFTPYSSNTNDVATFDVSAYLELGETLVSPTVVLVVEGPTGVVDLRPSARVLAGPTISGNTVSVMLGNWQSNIIAIQYSALLTFSTSLGNQRTALAIVNVGSTN